MPFIANSGQTDPSVAYYAPTFAGTVFVTESGRIVYSFQPESEAKPSGRQFPAAPAPRPGWSLTESLVGGKPNPSGVDPSPTRVSYFLGNDPSCWRRGLSTFRGVSLGEVWPGISLKLRAHGNNVEKVFTVRPGGDPSRIRLRVAGAKSLRADHTGALVASTDSGDVRFTPPAAYQERDGSRRRVEVAYQVLGDGYSFRTGDYDQSLPLVIDPLLQATYLGGPLGARGFALAIHPISGDVYAAGRTSSTDFPGTAGGAQPANAGGVDVFVARLTADLTALTRATYLGGKGTDIAFAIAIHSVSGDVYLAGETSSTDFPGTSGAAQPAYGGGSADGFVARLNADLTTLLKTTYLGGSGAEQARALAIHPASGNVYVTGLTASADFPGTSGGAQSSNAGGAVRFGVGGDAFVASLSADLTTLTNATYLGGSGDDAAYALAIHRRSGDVYVAGETLSTNFPGTAGSAQPSISTAPGLGLSSDAFVARLSADLTTLTRATYLGGTINEIVLGLAIHPASGDVYAVGATGSTDFPRTAGGAQPISGSHDTAFVARLSADLTTLTNATYLGGSGADHGEAVAINPTSGDVYVSGETSSTNFPATSGAAQPAYGGGAFDAFVARLSADLTTLVRATYLGGSLGDHAVALVTHPMSGNVYASGDTGSMDFPGTSGGAQSVNRGQGGNANAFVARLPGHLASSGCNADSTTLCLNDFRFRIQVQWTTPQGQSGAGQAVLLTSDTGYFWFFSSNNVEMIIKVVDGRAVNGKFWVFAAGLTNVNVVITVTDMQTGIVKTYTNPQGVAFQPIQDTSAFATTPDGAVNASAGDSATEAAETAISTDMSRLLQTVPRPQSSIVEASQALAITCTPDAATLCLNNGRFKVQTQFATPQGQNGVGQAVALTSDTGYFWFFSSNNVEMVVKVVTGCPLNSRYWVFAAGLTNVNVVIMVTDTQTGAVQTYTNPQGTAFQPIQDTSAFACP